MAARLIDGKAVAAALRTRIGAGVKTLQDNHNITPALAVVLVGNDAASEVYVRNKAIATKQVGMTSLVFELPADTSEAALGDKVRELNAAPDVNAILVQFPLPSHIGAHRIIDTISPEKDVDGLHPINVGRLVSGQLCGPNGALVPCTPQGIVVLAKQALAAAGDDLAGKHALVLGRSNLVGKPVAQLLLAENCTVTMAHSRTHNLPALCRTADIVVAAVGIAELVRGDWVKPGACVIDVGINRINAGDASAKPDGKTRLVGDVAFAEAQKTAGHITPVPGGVGPMTIACLLRNTLIATCRQAGVDEVEI